MRNVAPTPITTYDGRARILTNPRAAMAHINHDREDIVINVVYYGPGLAGKTSNLWFIHHGTRPDERSELIVSETRQESLYFLEVAPSDLPLIRGYRVRINLWRYGSNRLLSRGRRSILQDVDGVVFVADSRRARRSANTASLDDLVENLASYGRALEDITFVVQYNKRDLPNAVSLEELRADLNPDGVFPEFEAIANAQGAPGVFESLKSCVRGVLLELRAREW